MRISLAGALYMVKKVSQNLNSGLSLQKQLSTMIFQEK